MADQPIRKSELIDDGIFTNLIKEADIVIQKEAEIIDINKKLLKSYREIASANIGNNSKSLKLQAENTKKVEESITELNTAELNLIATQKAKVQLEQEELKLKKLVDAENRKNIRAINDLNGVYKKSVQDLARVKKELKELEITGRTNGKLYKALGNEFTELNKKVRSAEKRVGEFQRYVGEYPKILDSITGKLATAFSVGAIINFGQKILETRAEFQKFEAVLTNTLGSNSAAQGVLTRIQDLASKTPFSVKELTESFVKLANRGFKPTNEELIKLGDLASSQGKSFEQLTEALLDAQSGEFERLKEFGIRAKTVGDNVTLAFKGQEVTVNKFNEGALRNAILGFGELKGVAGGMDAISKTLGGRISNLGDNFDVFFNNLGQNTEGVFNTFLDSFNGFLDVANKAQTALNKINRELKAGGGGQSFIDNLTGGNAQLIGLNRTLEAIAKNGQGTAKQFEAYAKATAFVKAQFRVGKIDVDEYKNSLILIKTAQNELTESTKVSTEVKEKNTTATKKQTKATKDLKEAKQKETAEVLQSTLKEGEFDEKAFEEKLKIQTAETNVYEDELTKRKEKREQDYKDTLENSQRLLSIFSDEVEKKSKLRQDAFDKEITDTQKNIDTQRRLAENGKANTLAEEEARKIQLERQKEDEKEKEIKRQKALAFFKAYIGFLDKGDSALEALAKAGSSIAIADAVAGSFFVGTENVERDLKGNKVHNGRDGHIIAVDGSERILTGEQNKKIGALSNNELADLAKNYNNGLLNTVNIGVTQTDNFAKKVSESALLMHTIALRNEISDIKEVIKNRPVSNWTFDKYGDFIKESIENGINKRTRFKQPKPRI